jgi:hypothetical protein
VRGHTQGALVRDANGAILLEHRLSVAACEAALSITDALEAAHGQEKICCLACIGGTYLCAGGSSMAREVPAGLLAHGEPEPVRENKSGAFFSLSCLQPCLKIVSRLSWQIITFDNDTKEKLHRLCFAGNCWRTPVGKPG